VSQLFHGQKARSTPIHTQAELQKIQQDTGRNSLTETTHIENEDHAVLLHLQTEVVRCGLAGDWDRARMYRAWADRYRRLIEEGCE